MSNAVEDLKFKNCFQLFHNLNCCVENKQQNEDMVIDDDIEVESDLKDILNSLSEKEMKNHIIKCVASLVFIQRKVKGLNEKNDRNEEINNADKKYLSPH